MPGKQLFTHVSKPLEEKLAKLDFGRMSSWSVFGAFSMLNRHLFTFPGKKNNAILLYSKWPGSII